MFKKLLSLSLLCLMVSCTDTTIEHPFFTKKEIVSNALKLENRVDELEVILQRQNNTITELTERLKLVRNIQMSHYVQNSSEILLRAFPLYSNSNDQDYILALSLIEEEKVTEALYVAEYLISNYIAYEKSLAQLSPTELKSPEVILERMEQDKLYVYAQYLMGFASYQKEQYELAIGSFSKIIYKTTEKSLLLEARSALTFSFAKLHRNKKACLNKDIVIQGLTDSPLLMKKFTTNKTIRGLRCK